MACNFYGVKFKNERLNVVNDLIKTAFQNEEDLVNFIKIVFENEDNFENYVISRFDAVPKEEQTPKKMFSIVENYYKGYTKRSIRNRHIKNQQAFNGFSSTRAFSIAQRHAATEFIKLYYKAASTGKTLNKNDMIRSFINSFKLNNFKLYKQLLKKYDNEDENINEIIKDVNDIRKEINYLRIEERLLKEKGNELADEEYETEDIDERDRLNKEMDEIQKQINDIEKQIKGELIDDEYEGGLYNKLRIRQNDFILAVGNDRQKNVANIGILLGDPHTSKDFINKIFQTPAMVLINKEFSKVLKDESLYNNIALDDEDVYALSDETDSERILNAWEDVIPKDFSANISPRIRLYLSQLKELNDDGTEKTDDELGAPIIMSGNFVISQLISRCDFTSPDRFFADIAKISEEVSGLKGLTQILEDVKTDPNLKNKLFVELNRPVVRKVIIETAGALNSICSNNSANALSKCIYTMINNIKHTRRSTYHYYTIDKLTSISEELDEFTDSDFNNADKSLDKTEIVFKLEDLLKKYFPNLDTNGVRKYLLDKNDSPRKRFTTVINFIRDVAVKSDNILDAVNNARQEFNRVKRMQGELLSDDGILFNHRNFDENDVLIDGKPISEAYNTLFATFAKEIYTYTAIKTELTTSNGERHLSSDSINMNYILNILQNIQKGDNIDENKGLKLLLDKYGHSEEFKYSPFFFGVQDKNGNTIHPGIFVRDKEGNVTINPDAKNVIKFSYFDGVNGNDASDGVTYPNMTGIDYLISQLVLMHQTSKDVSEAADKNSDYIEVVLKTPSDAPKNFNARIRRYKTTGLFTTNTYENILNSAFNRNLYSYSMQYNNEDFYKRIIKITNLKNNIYYNNNIVDEKDTSLISRIMAAFNNSPIEDIIVNGSMYAIDDGDYKIIPIILRTRDEVGKNKTSIVYLRGNYNEDYNGEVIINNIELAGVEGDIDNIFETYKDYIVSEGIEKGYYENGVHKNVELGVKKNHVITNALRQIIKGEINLYVNQLNHIIDFDENGNPVIKKNIILDKLNNTELHDYLLSVGYTEEQIGRMSNDIKKEKYKQHHIKGLFEHMHFIEDKNGNVYFTDENGIVSKFADFCRMFNVGSFNYKARLNELLSLYRGVEKIGNDRFGINVNLLDDTSLLSYDANNQSTPFSLNEAIFENEDFNKGLDSIISDFISEFQKETFKSAKRYGKLVGQLYTNEQIFEWAINGYINNINFDDFLEGNSKFYKNVQTMLKREKQVQAGGSTYAHDAFAPFDEGLKEETENVTLGVGDNAHNVKMPYNSITKRENGVMKVRNGFRAVTVYNTKRKANAYARQHTEMVDIYKKQGINEETAKQMATALLGGYQEKTAVNDAQSYITFEEWIQRRYHDGTIGEYTDIIDKINSLDENSNPSLIDLKEINSRIQVQKNFYYDIAKDPKTGLNYCRQIKNAEFVLIPQLLPKGSQLRALYDVMSRNDIGQINTLETSKAANKNVLRLWEDTFDAEGKTALDLDIFEKDIKDTDNVETYYYRFLYKQQEVPSHMKDEENKAGLQVIKKLVDNVRNISYNIDGSLDDETRERLNAEQIKLQRAVETFFDAFAANIEESFDSLMESLGWKMKNGRVVNKDGNIISKQEFYARTQDEAARLGLDSNFMDYFTMNADGDPIMPNWMNVVSTKIESVAQSFFNSAITRQTFNGWHAAQVSSIGIDDMILNEEGKYQGLRYHPDVYVRNPSLTKEEMKDLEREISIEEYENLNDDIKEKYVRANYCEIMISRNSSKIPQGYDIKKLEEEGLDMMIGYRIPTEGKQSISIMKVVGFLNDCYDSTVMVPEEWVIQTGSDFDVDSIYAITYPINNYTEKVRFDNGEDIESKKRQYIEYVRQYASGLRGYSITNRDKIAINKKYAKELLSDNKSEDYDSANLAEQESYENLPSDYREIVIEQTTKRVDEDGIKIKHADRLQNALTACAVELRNEEVGTDRYNRVSNFIASLEKLIKEIKLSNEKYYNNREIYENTKDDNERKEIEKLKEHRLNKAKEYAKDLGLVSFEDFCNWNIYKRNTKEQRMTLILDQMLTIMNSENSREENYSRSNFDDITNFMAKWDGLRGASAISRSSYNPFDQLYFMDNAMSGRQLKAFSVTRDTFASTCNYVHTTLGKAHTVRVQYDLSDPQYKIEDIFKAYDNNATFYDKDGNILTIYTIDNNGRKVIDYTVANKATSVIVEHNKLGWSNNNKNIVGKILTSYSSQTTAHILDVMKSGAIFNENKFTFGTFKTLIDLGIDYDTAIGFLMQPAITMINEIYTTTNTVFDKQVSDPIKQAYREIALKLKLKVNGKPITEYTSIAETYNAIVEHLQQEIAERGLNFTSTDQRSYYDNRLSFEYIMDKRQFEERIKRTNAEEYTDEDALSDLQTVLMFEKIHITTQNIEAIARCTNSDSYGAKQSIFETRRKIEDIEEFSNYADSNEAKMLEDLKVKLNILENTPEYNKTENDKNTEEEYKKSIKLLEDRLTDRSILTYSIHDKASTLLATAKDGEIVPMLQAIFPVKENGEIDVDSSAYKNLAAFYKYVTKTSVDVNKEVFEIENDEFYNGIVTEIQKALNIKFTADTYRQFKQYFINNVYDVPTLLSPTTIDDNGKIIIDSRRIKENKFEYWNVEKDRICGLNVNDDYRFSSLNIYDPSKGEIEKFNELTPAQKAVAIVQMFPQHELGIFAFLNIREYDSDMNAAKGYSFERITWNDQVDNIEDLITAFKDSYYNENPLIRLAAIDLVKYAFIREGFSFKRGNISKFIANDVILDKTIDGGMDLLGQFVDNLRSLRNVNRDQLDLSSTSIINKYARSHTNVMRTFNLGRSDKSLNGTNEASLFDSCNIPIKENDKTKNSGLVYIPMYEKYLPLITKLQLTTGNKNAKFIKISRKIGKNNVVTLYKIETTNFGVFLIPLNNLDIDETYAYSLNNSNNKFPPQEYYESVIKEFKDNRSSNQDRIERREVVRIISDLLSDNNTPFVKDTRKRIHTYGVIENENTLADFQKRVNETVGFTAQDEIQVNKFVDDILDTEDKTDITLGNIDQHFIVNNNYHISRHFNKKGNNQNIYQKLVDENGIEHWYSITPLEVYNKSEHSKLIKVLKSLRDINEGKRPYNLDNPEIVTPFIKNLLDNTAICSKEELDNGRIKYVPLVLNPSIYEIKVVPEEEIQEYKQEQEEAIEDSKKFASTTTTSINENLSDQMTPAEEAAKDLHNYIIRRRRFDSRASIYAKNVGRYSYFVKNNGEEGVDFKNVYSIRANLKTIYESSRDYFVNTANELEYKMNHFFANTDEFGEQGIAINDDRLFDYLDKNVEKGSELANLLLDIITFGKRARSVTLLLAEDNQDIINYIEQITDAINRISGNKLVLSKNGALFKFMNKYMANNFSTNPQIREGILNITDIFGDITSLDHNIASILEMPHEQVQVFAKYINNAISVAQEFAGPRAVKEFTKRYREILSKGNINMNNVVKDGRLAKDYTDKFLEDRKALYEARRKAEEEFGIYSNEWIDADYALERFLTANVERQYAQEYYQKRLEIRKNIIYGDEEKGISAAKERYGAYHQLLNELYSYAQDDLLSKEEITRKNEIKHQIYKLGLNKFTITDEWMSMTAEEKKALRETPEFQQEEREVASFRKYKLDNVQLNKDYFESEDKIEFKEMLEKYQKFMEDYDNSHPDESIKFKLENNKRYKEAYDWINENCIATPLVNMDGELVEGDEFLEEIYDIIGNKSESISEEELDKIIETVLNEHPEIKRKETKVITIGNRRRVEVIQDGLEDNELISIARKEHPEMFINEKMTVGSVISYIKAIHPEYFHEGRFDPSKMTNEDLDLIKQAIKNEQLFGVIDPEDSMQYNEYLYKDVPESRILTKDFYKKISNGLPEDKLTIEAKKTAIHIINGYIEKVLRKNHDSYISFGTMIDTLTKEEKEDIIECFNLLHAANRNKAMIAKTLSTGNFGMYAEFKINQNAFDSVRAEYTSRRLNKLDKELFRVVFCDGKSDRKANPELYGYIVPKNDSFIDKEREDAIKDLNENVMFTPTLAYFNAMENAKQNNTYEDWYEHNHYWDPSTRTIKPLPIWTERKFNPAGPRHARYEYEALPKNKDRIIKKQYNNDINVIQEDGTRGKYYPNGLTYNKETGEYNNNELTNEESEMRNFLQDTLTQYSCNDLTRKFTNKGYMPRRYAANIDAKWLMNEVIGAAGFSVPYSKDEESWHRNVEYSYDFDAPFDMLSFLRTKDTKERLPMPERTINADGTIESDEDYNKRVEEVRAKNKKIDEHNRQAESSVMDTNWEGVMQEFVRKAIVYNTKDKLKNMAYLLLEDMKQNPAYRRSAISENLRVSEKNSTNTQNVYQTEAQNKIIENFEVWFRRTFLNEFKEYNKYNRLMGTLQQATSAKYMIFNVTGGFANITTGMINMLGERFAEEYGNAEDYRWAQGYYLRNGLNFVADWFTEKSTSLAGALTKRYNVVDFESMLERYGIKTESMAAGKVREFLYSAQSGGEHMMQNMILFHMLKSSKIFEKDGKLIAGNFKDFTSGLETAALISAIDEIDSKNESNPQYKKLINFYNRFVDSIKKDPNRKKEYAEYKYDKNIDFINLMNNAELEALYIKKREEILKDSKQRWNENKNTVFSNYVFKDGEASKIDGSLLTEEMEADLRNRVFSINQKIHGVYDRIGGARIESLWYGSLVMQYHKHIYPGIMKRYRGFIGRGYYNETRRSEELGGLYSLYKLAKATLSPDNKRLNSIGNDIGVDYAIPEESHKALEVLQNIITNVPSIVENAKRNWKLLPQWEKNNIWRLMGDTVGIGLAFIAGIALHLMWDDDDFKDSVPLSTMLFLSDRCFSEAWMFTPTGLYTEARTLYSSPVAAQNAIVDLLYCMNLGLEYMFDPDFDINYARGIYKGQNKIAVRLYRNVPAVRIYRRLENMPNSNQYYRIGDTNLNIKLAKRIADYVKEN